LQLVGELALPATTYYVWIIEQRSCQQVHNNQPTLLTHNTKLIWWFMNKVHT